MRYDRLSRGGEDQYVHVSVNMDRSTSVFNSVIAIDDLDRSAQFFSSLESQGDIIKGWRLEEGYHSFLIDKTGVIIAVDPDEKALAQVH